MLYVLENTEEIKDPTLPTPSDEIITDGAISDNASVENASVETTSEEVTSENTSSEESENTSTEENTSLTTSTEAPKEWPKGGFESFTNHALPSLVLGMLGIFLVLGLISIATMALNKMFPGNKDK
jgi:hypothetical protein